MIVLSEDKNLNKLSLYEKLKNGSLGVPFIISNVDDSTIYLVYNLIEDLESYTSKNFIMLYNEKNIVRPMLINIASTSQWKLYDKPITIKNA